MKSKLVWVILFAVILLLILFAAYRINPYAPLFVILSLLIQAPIIYGVARVVFGKSYRQRAKERRDKFLKDGDLALCLQQEENEASSAEFAHWSLGGRYANYINRAELLLLAERREEAWTLLFCINPSYLNTEDKERYYKLMQIEWVTETEAKPNEETR